MSKLPAQCYELRAMAESVGLAVPQAATLMMGAADTIDRLDAENAKLRKLLLDCLEFPHLMHRQMAARYYELGLIGRDEARELCWVEVDT